jgi:hypothetical protein
MIAQVIGEADERWGDTLLASEDDELAALDERLREVETWIDRAADALLGFRFAAGFRRSSASAAKDLGSTSTARSFFALHEYRRFLVEEGRRDRGKPVDEALAAMIRGWALKARTPEGLSEIRSFPSDNQPNLFTDCHIITSLALVPNLAAELGLGATYNKSAVQIRRACHTLNQKLLKQMKKRGELGVRLNEPGHHFITFHAVRAADSLGDVDGGLGPEHLGPLALEAENQALQQLAYRSAKVMARFDPARLAFAATLLRRLKVADWRQLAESSIETVVASQTEDGAWPTSQLVAYRSPSMLHVSSYELALALACMSLRELSHGEIGLVRIVLPSLDRVMDLVRASYVTNQDHGLKGWGNDRTRWEGLVESWATAIVLTLLLRMREVILAFRQELVLRRYRADRPQRFPTPWPDLAGALFPTRKIDPGPLNAYSDPTPKRALVRALRRQLLEPIASQMGQRPEKASLILYGAPGTRKTSLVRACAKTLSWPLVTLSPPDFLGDGGLEGFEVSAARIFEDLMRLRRVVVLFDECEDFFKPRPADDEEKRGEGDEIRRNSDPGNDVDAHEPEVRAQSDAGTRTIGAFLTAGMLPRLQALRDRRWVLFVLATNSGLAALDPAVRRPGRFDFAECLKHPVLGAQKRYVDGHRRRMSRRQRREISDALEEVSKMDLDLPGKRVPFAVIDHVVNTIRDKNMQGTKEQAVAMLVERVKNIEEPPSLTGAAGYSR